MFVDNAVVKEIEGEKRYDKFAIASILYDVSFKGASCSALEAHNISDCEGCELICLCSKIDKIVEEYTEMTTVVRDNFSFNG